MRIARLGTPYSDGCEDGIAFKKEYNTSYSRRVLFCFIFHFIVVYFNYFLFGGQDYLSF